MSTTTVSPGADLRESAINALAPASAFIAGSWRDGGGTDHIHRDPATGDQLRSWCDKARPRCRKLLIESRRLGWATTMVLSHGAATVPHHRGAARHLSLGHLLLREAGY